VLLVFGGGHVGQALARLAIPLGYDVTVADDREEYASPNRFPEGAVVVRTARDYRLPEETLRPGRERYVAVVSRCWETDLAAVRPWVADGAPEVRYLGVIGSARKVREVFEKLAEEGVSAGRIARIRAPIGLEIGAVTPEEIAVSILAEMTAVRRGVSVPTPVESTR
jgi:xanthine dehydrogenase accessory factor